MSEPPETLTIGVLADAAGVNVEDVTIDHDTQAERGWLAVHVEATAAEPLTAAMTAAGWNVRPTA